MEDIKARNRFLAAVAITIANLGNEQIIWGFVAQLIASFVESGDNTPATLAGVYNDISNQTACLLSEGGIWDELVPGPVRDEPEWDELLAAMNLMMLGFKVEHVSNALENEPKNIVLNYPVRIIRTVGDGVVEMLRSDRAEFFVDEHGIQWVKFIAQNGDYAGEEQMIRTDCDGFAVSKR